MIESSRQNLSARGKAILGLALAKLESDPPEIPKPPPSERCNTAVYHKLVGDTVVEGMRERGYKVEHPQQWRADFEVLEAVLLRLERKDIQPSEFQRSIQRARKRLGEMRIDAVDNSEKSDGEWEDVDTSCASSKSFSSKGSSRNSNMLNAKKSLKQTMQDGAKKGPNLSSRLESNKSIRLKKNTSTSDFQAGKSENQPSALKRQASTVVSSDAKKEKKTSSHETDKTEFARAQNCRVQLVKERKEIKEKERSDSIKAKLQQKQIAMKENEKVPKRSKPVQKTSSSAAKSVRAAAAVAADAAHANKSTNHKQAPGTLVKSALLAASTTSASGKFLPLESSPFANQGRFHSMQAKASEDRRHGGLAKQAMYQSILAAGEELGGAINSTFLPGVESQPDFDASLALKGLRDTFVVGKASNATFVSKPGLLLTPSRKNPIKETAASFLDSFNETFRDYGLDDLCSDSDNTDDESKPSKPVPKWAHLKSARFKEKVSKQRQLSNSITKYGLLNIYMPPSVDLAMIFGEENDRFERHNTSSGIWNDTKDFIKN